MRRLLLVGTTGLVGQSVLQQALANPSVQKVVALTRRPLPEHPKLLNPVVRFEALPEQEPWWAVDAVICTLGTTLKAAGSKAAFYQVDHDYPLLVAELARRKGARVCALNSALGADVGSRVFLFAHQGRAGA